MMNLKLTICSWILFFIILSSDTHAAPEAVYSGPIVTSNNPLHPTQICRTALNDKSVYWSFVDGSNGTCSSNIKCRKGGSKDEVELTQVPANGVICHVDFGKVDENYPPSNLKILACYNKQCTLSK